jgi:hypothetical protein
MRLYLFEIKFLTKVLKFYPFESFTTKRKLPDTILYYKSKLLYRLLVTTFTQ